MNQKISKPQDWHVLGAGAMGCWWGSQLLKRGHIVTLLTRNRAPTRARITVEHDLVQAHFYCDAIPVDSASPPDKPTALLVTLKAHKTLAGMTALSELFPYYSVIVLMQNGMGVAEQIRRHYPELPLLIGITNQGAYRLDNLHIVPAGQADTWIGCLPEEPIQTGPDAVQDLLNISPGPVKWDPHILNRQWTKLAVNCVINGLTVVENCHNGQLLEVIYKDRIADLCKEIETVMSHHIAVDSKGKLLQEVLRVADATSTNFSSMRQDVQNGRTTEVEYLHGYLCHRADTLNIAIPENHKLYSEILSIATT